MSAGASVNRRLTIGLHNGGNVVMQAELRSDGMRFVTRRTGYERHIIGDREYFVRRYFDRA